MDQEEGGGVEGILSRLKKERNLSFITSGKVVNGLDSYRKPIVDRHATSEFAFQFLIICHNINKIILVLLL